MEDYNSVLLDGMLNSDPIRGMVQKGECCSTARFALCIKVNTIAGSYCDNAPVKVFAEKLVEKCMCLLKKGMMIRVVGRLSVTSDEWFIIADHIEIKNLQL